MEIPAEGEVERGERVEVYTPGGKEFIGYGTYEGEVLICEQDGIDDEIKAVCGKEDRTPKIVLESGKTMYGFECFWRKPP